MPIDRSVVIKDNFVKIQQVTDSLIKFNGDKIIFLESLRYHGISYDIDLYQEFHEALNINLPSAEKPFMVVLDRVDKESLNPVEALEDMQQKIKEAHEKLVKQKQIFKEECKENIQDYSDHIFTKKQS